MKILGFRFVHRGIKYLKSHPDQRIPLIDFRDQNFASWSYKKYVSYGFSIENNNLRLLKLEK